MRLWYNLEEKILTLICEILLRCVFFSFFALLLSFSFVWVSYYFYDYLFFIIVCVRGALLSNQKPQGEYLKLFKKQKKRSKTKTNKKPYNTPLYITTITTRRGAKIARYCKKPQLDRSRKLALHSLARSLRSLDIVSSVKEKLCTFPSRDTLDRRGALCRAPDTIQATASVCLAINSGDSISERCKRERQSIKNKKKTNKK